MANRFTAAMMTCVLLVAAGPRGEARGVTTPLDTRIRCESGLFGSYRFCRVETDNEVRLVRELSNRKCRQWRSWGYDRRGVWVDDGCRAEFEVGRGPGAGTAAAVVGAVAGAAIIGAILAGRDDHKAESTPIPEWNVGSFSGFSPKQNRDFEIRIAEDGAVSGESDGDKVAGHVTRDHLHLGKIDFVIRKEKYGFSATQADDANHVIYFRRQ